MNFHEQPTQTGPMILKSKPVTVTTVEHEKERISLQEVVHAIPVVSNNSVITPITKLTVKFLKYRLYVLHQMTRVRGACRNGQRKMGKHDSWEGINDRKRHRRDGLMTEIVKVKQEMF